MPNVRLWDLPSLYCCRSLTLSAGFALLKLNTIMVINNNNDFEMLRWSGRPRLAARPGYDIGRYGKNKFFFISWVCIALARVKLFQHTSFGTRFSCSTRIRYVCTIHGLASVSDRVVRRHVDHVLAAGVGELHPLEQEVERALAVRDAGGEDAEQQVERVTEEGHEEGDEDEDEEPEEAAQELGAVGGHRQVVREVLHRHGMAAERESYCQLAVV